MKHIILTISLTLFSLPSMADLTDDLIYNETKLLSAKTNCMMLADNKGIFHDSILNFCYTTAYYNAAKRLAENHEDHPLVILYRHYSDMHYATGELLEPANKQ